MKTIPKHINVKTIRICTQRHTNTHAQTHKAHIHAHRHTHTHMQTYTDTYRHTDLYAAHTYINAHTGTHMCTHTDTISNQKQEHIIIQVCTAGENPRPTQQLSKKFVSLCKWEPLRNLRIKKGRLWVPPDSQGKALRCPCWQMSHQHCDFLMIKNLKLSMIHKSGKASVCFLASLFHIFHGV